MALAQGQCASPENAPIQGAEPSKQTAPTNPASLQPAILQPQPTKTTPPHQRGGPSSNIEKNRASVVGRTDICQQPSVQPTETKNHSGSTSSDDVHNWDTSDGVHPFFKPYYRSSDTSSVSEDMSIPGKRREPDWDPVTGFWEPYMDSKDWSDSDATTDDMQAPSQGLQNSRSVPQSCTADKAQALPVKEEKHPRPKYNERCRRWLRDECNLGYQCNFVHEDLEYDDSPVSY